MPGGRMRFIEKAASLDVDVVCMDLEDGVPDGEAKAEARATIRSALETLNFGRSDVAVRINSPRLDEKVARDDLEAVLSAPVLPQTLAVPKVDTVDELEWLLASAEPILSSRSDYAKDGERHRLGLVPMCESPLGLLNLDRILAAGTNPQAVLDLQAVIFGGDDYAAEVGAVRSESNEELLMARQTVVATCRAFGVQPLDIVHIDLSGTDKLFQEALQGASWGFAGKQIIHPSQIEPVQKAFTPTPEELSYARELLEAFEKHYSAAADDDRKGAFTFRGKMIDTPTVLIAQNVIARADPSAASSS
eukprot:CAMPEP_0184479998 /NCGR_PEP_ID=MMETSP0113_2-20130426/1493_1 /TAXON_ID=91329 /ORGANISM="Norrisiella sphaerica, Strain BC52" /LENGTH=304 /DNA_ID=CAMNT_0026858179 /DNA_START=243 /DNA_END=1157 /DNA_ORIENTATION=+